MARTKDFNEEEVLKKACDLFWHQGYNATSMQELVDGLGISRSSLYDTYVDKRTLYLKALEFYKESATARVLDLLAQPTNAKTKIRQLIEIVAGDLLGDVQKKGCFMVNAGVEVAPHDLEVRTIVQENEDQIEASFKTLIRDGQKSGEISSRQDAKALARFFLNTVKGIRVSAATKADKSVFNDIIKTSMLVLE